MGRVFRFDTLLEIVFIFIVFILLFLLVGILQWTTSLSVYLLLFIYKLMKLTTIMGGIHVLSRDFLFVRYYHVRIQFIVSFEYPSHSLQQYLKVTEGYTLTRPFITC